MEDPGIDHDALDGHSLLEDRRTQRFLLRGDRQEEERGERRHAETLARRGGRAYGGPDRYNPLDSETSMAVETLAQLFELMHSTIPARRALTLEALASQPGSPDAIRLLRNALGALEAIPDGPTGRRLAIEGGRSIRVELGYEIGELRKDVAFLEQGEQALLAQLAERHKGLRDEVAAGLDALEGIALQTFVTDRDGTVNNYAGRYGSSVQSTYNAVFLTRFARSRVRAHGSVLLTSAPLDDTGIADMAVTPPGTFVFAGSKGREYFDIDGRRSQYPVEPAKQKRLDEFNDRLGRLLEEPGNEVFRLIGSGLQLKFGETTIARQDIGSTVPREDAARFLGQVRRLVRSVDPGETVLHLQDTGLDVEIRLTVDDARGGAARDFDKGDGLRFLNKNLGLGLHEGACLVCGDTDADVPMLEAALDLAPETHAVFVTDDEERQHAVRERLPDTLFVSEPDTLMALLNALGGGSRP
jgi:hypothetical protein